MASASATSLTKRQTALEPAARGAVSALRGTSKHLTLPGKAASSAGICVACMYAAVEKTVRWMDSMVGSKGPVGGTGAGEGAVPSASARRGHREADRDRYFVATRRESDHAAQARRGATSEEEIRVAFNIVAARSVCG